MGMRENSMGLVLALHVVELSQFLLPTWSQEPEQMLFLSIEQGLSPE